MNLFYPTFPPIATTILKKYFKKLSPSAIPEKGELRGAILYS